MCMHFQHFSLYLEGLIACSVWVFPICSSWGTEQCRLWQVTGHVVPGCGDLCEVRLMHMCSTLLWLKAVLSVCVCMCCLFVHTQMIRIQTKLCLWTDWVWFCLRRSAESGSALFFTFFLFCFRSFFCFVPMAVWVERSRSMKTKRSLSRSRMQSSCIRQTHGLKSPMMVKRLSCVLVVAC